MTHTLWHELNVCKCSCRIAISFLIIPHYFISYPIRTLPFRARMRERGGREKESETVLLEFRKLQRTRFSFCPVVVVLLADDRHTWRYEGLNWKGALGIVFQMQFAVISLFGGRHRIRVLPGGYLINLCKFKNNGKFVGFCATGNFATNRLLLLLYDGLRESSSSSFLPSSTRMIPPGPCCVCAVQWDRVCYQRTGTDPILQLDCQCVIPCHYLGLLSWRAQLNPIQRARILCGWLVDMNGWEKAMDGMNEWMDEEGWTEVELKDVSFG